MELAEKSVVLRAGFNLHPVKPLVLQPWREKHDRPGSSVNGFSQGVREALPAAARPAAYRYHSLGTKMHGLHRKQPGSVSSTTVRQRLDAVRRHAAQKVGSRGEGWGGGPCPSMAAPPWRFADTYMPKASEAFADI